MHKVLLVAHVSTSSSDKLTKEVEFPVVPATGDLVHISHGLVFAFQRVARRYFYPSNEMPHLHFDEIGREVYEHLIANDEGWEKS